VRTCRYCMKRFEPVKPYYWWCSFECREASAAREGRSTYDMGYRDGFSAGYTRGLAEGQQQDGIPPELFRPLIAMVHPDHWQGSALACAADTCVRWLLEHRPDEARRN
jgi:hypothetical protein